MRSGHTSVSLYSAREKISAGLTRSSWTGGYHYETHTVQHRDELIGATCPFPELVFLTLNLGRFEQLLGSVDAIAEKLVWVPTENQARWISRRLGGDGEKSARA